MIYQSDIFGNIKSAEDVCSKSVGNKSIKQKYRQMYGYDNNHICKDCQHLKAIYNRDKRYYKCEYLHFWKLELTEDFKKKVVEQLAIDLNARIVK